jgi:hypothetical protein
LSSDRYPLLLRLLQFSDNNNQSNGDRVYKRKPIIDHLKKQFNEIFTPFGKPCTDVGLTLFKGQHYPSEKQICNKELCYEFDLIVYTGREPGHVCHVACVHPFSD